MVMLEIPEDLDKRLATMAERLQISKEDLVVQALEEHLEEYEELLAALARYEEYIQSGKPALSFEEFEEKFLFEEELP